jgi:hypothetical protein
VSLLGSTTRVLECLTYLNHVDGWAVRRDDYLLLYKPCLLVATDRPMVVRSRVGLDLRYGGVQELTPGSVSSSHHPSPPHHSTMWGRFSQSWSIGRSCSVMRRKTIVPDRDPASPKSRPATLAHCVGSRLFQLRVVIACHALRDCDFRHRHRCPRSRPVMELNNSPINRIAPPNNCPLVGTSAKIQ